MNWLHNFPHTILTILTGDPINSEEMCSLLVNRFGLKHLLNYFCTETVYFLLIYCSWRIISCNQGLLKHDWTWRQRLSEARWLHSSDAAVSLLWLHRPTTNSVNSISQRCLDLLKEAHIYSENRSVVLYGFLSQADVVYSVSSSDSSVSTD